MILTGYRYAHRLALNQFPEVDFKRFRPAACFEVFPVWMDYIRKHFPNEHVLFFDNFSPISFEEGAKIAGITDFERISPESYTYNKNTQFHVKTFAKPYYYFHSVQRQRVEAIKFAYLNDIDFYWQDTDCLLNTNVNPHIKDSDIFSLGFQHHQQTFDTHCFYISKQRLHQWDNHYNLIEFLEYILNQAPDEKQSVRHNLLFESGMYRMFCYGKVTGTNNYNGAHASCYKNFVKWLELNPLDTDSYRNLLNLLKNIDQDKLKDYLLEFEDTFEVEK